MQTGSLALALPSCGHLEYYKTNVKACVHSELKSSLR